MSILRCSAHTDVGPRREHNEDTFLVDEALGLYVVLDGAGAGAPVARGILDAALHVLPAALRRRAARDRGGTLDGADLLDAVHEANVEMHRITQTHAVALGSVATMVALLAPPESDVAWLAWVGDCMALHAAPDALRLVPAFEPHTLVVEQLRAGLITEDEAKESAFRNIITRALASQDTVDPGVIEVRIDHRMVLCSDGLLSAWPTWDDAYARVAELLLITPIERAARELVDAACARGASDNVTVIVVERSP